MMFSILFLEFKVEELSNLVCDTRPCRIEMFGKILK